MELSGKVALVTGGAHRVGRGISLALAGRGMRIALHYKTSKQAAQATAQDIAALGGEAQIIQADLAQPDQIAGIFEQMQALFGRLDVLVNSAASFQKKAFEAITLAEWESTLALNLRAPFLCTQHAVDLMRQSEREGGAACVINIADHTGISARIGYSHHGISKAGLLHLTRSSAIELAPDIRVNALVPGVILPPPGVAEDSDQWQKIIQHVPLGRSGSPEDVGKAAVFLAENDFVTGAILTIDGGEGI